MTEKIYIMTLGCPKNQVDSRQMTGMLKQDGFLTVDTPQAAEIIILNTCGFVDSAKEESIAAILDLSRFKSEGKCRKLVVVGCLVQKYGEELAEVLPEVDLFLGTADWTRLAELLRLSSQTQTCRVCIGSPEQFLFRNEWALNQPEESYTGYVKIADGCDHRCTFCVIPSMRGAYRSRPKADILEEVRARAKAGLKEAILVAQDTGCYGKDLKPTETLASLIKALCEIPELQWIRVMYCYPEAVTDELLAAMRHEKVCPYIDMPIQHVADPVLKGMARPLSAEGLKNKLRKIREALPDVFIRTTLMVGFPGETLSQFNELLDFLKEFQIERAGFFAFSPQPGTKAESMGAQVSEEEKERRLALAQNVQSEILAQREGRLVGQVVPVMVDGPAETRKSRDGMTLWEGRTHWDAPEIDGYVSFRAVRALKPGDLVRVLITHSQDYTLLGEIIDEPC